MAIEFDIFSDIPSGEQAFRRRYWEQKRNNPDDVTKMTEKINIASIHAKTSWVKNSQNATVETVLKERNPHAEILDFYQAQHDLAKNGLPDGAKNGAQLSGAIVQLFDQQFHRPEDFSDTTTFSGKANEFNPKEPYRNFKKKPDEMTVTPSEAFDLIYPMPFGNTNPQSPATKPTSSLPEGTLAADPANEGFKNMQKDNTIDWIGSKYLPSGTQDGKRNNFVPPQFQLSSASEASLGCLMAMIPESQSAQFTDFAKQNINSNNLHEKGFEDEPHITAMYGFAPDFSSAKLEKMLAGTGPISFTVGEVGRFECPDFDVLYLNVNSPDLEIINAKIAREFANEIDNSNAKYTPHLTLGYVQKGTNQHLDGKTMPKSNFVIGQLMYSGPHKSNRQMISVAWDAQKYSDLEFQDGIGTKKKNEPLHTMGDYLQKHLIEHSEQRRSAKLNIESQLKKTLEEKQRLNR